LTVKLIVATGIIEFVNCW